MKDEMGGHRIGWMNSGSMMDGQIFVYIDGRLDGWVNGWTEV